MQALTGAPTATEGGYVDSDPDISEQANMAARAIGESCTHARTWCEQVDELACEFLVTDCGWTEDDVAELAEQVEAFEIEMDELLTDDGGRVKSGQPVEAPAVPETDENPGFAKGTPKRAWKGHLAAIADASEYQDATEQFEASRSEAERYAQIVWGDADYRQGEYVSTFEQDEELGEKLEDELPGILNWTIEGYHRLIDQGRFSGERSVDAKKEMWAEHGDTIDRFKSEILELTGEAAHAHPKADVYAVYTAFCDYLGQEAGTLHKLTRELKKDQMIDDDEQDATRYYTGIKLAKTNIGGRKPLANKAPMDDSRQQRFG